MARVKHQCVSRWKVRGLRDDKMLVDRNSESAAAIAPLSKADPRWSDPAAGLSPTVPVSSSAPVRALRS